MNVQVTRRAEKDLRRLPKDRAREVLQALKALEHWPHVEGLDLVKLKGEELNLYRLRLGDYRVLFLVEEEIYILRVVSRQDLEKALRQLLSR